MTLLDLARQFEQTRRRSSAAQIKASQAKSEYVEAKRAHEDVAALLADKLKTYGAIVANFEGDPYAWYSEDGQTVIRSPIALGAMEINS